jgi:hypothetical protein
MTAFQPRVRPIVIGTMLLVGAGLAVESKSPPAPAPPVAPARLEWKAGVARVLVTPREPIFMKGYGSRTKPSEGVRQDLFVKALALQHGTGPIAVLVTSDLHSYTRRMSDTIADAVQKQHGITRDRLVLNGSHTHSGPAITAEAVFRPSEDINPEQQAVIRRYTAQLLDRVVSLIGDAIGNLAPAEVAFGQGAAGFGVNRRRIAAGMRHLPSHVDQDVPGDERIDLEGIYTDLAGADRVSGKAPRVTVGAFSMGKDETLGRKGDRAFRRGAEKSDDVVSWE